MIIGDWDVQIISSKDIPNQPGNPSAGSTKTIDYTFKHEPTGFVFPRTLIYFTFHNEEKILEVLTNQTQVLNSLKDQMNQSFPNREVNPS